jgi:ATPase family associated with various cellular activities (AAA)
MSDLSTDLTRVLTSDLTRDLAARRLGEHPPAVTRIDPLDVGPLDAWRGTAARAGRRFAALAREPASAAACDRAVRALDDPAADTVLRRIATGFGLSPFEVDVLTVIGLPEEHEALTELAQCVHPLGEPRLSFAGLAATFGLDDAGRIHLRRAIETGPLARFGLLAAPRQTPLPVRSLYLTDGLWEVIRGGDAWPVGSQPRTLPQGVVAEFPNRLSRMCLTDAGVILVTGATDRPCEESAALVAAKLEIDGYRCLGFDVAAVEGEHAAATNVHLVARAALPVVVGPPTAAVLPDHPGTVIVCVDAGAVVPLDDRPVVEIALGPRSLGDSVRMWEAVAPELDGDAPVLAGLLRVDHLRAARAVRDARCAMTGDARLDVETIVHQVRRRSDGQLPPSVRRVEPSARRDRLVTTADNDALLRSIVDRVRSQVCVLHDWGFSSVGGARGIRALFSGPPGTGKTLSAEITAAELGLDLLVVDLSALVSKWLGETEKHLGEVFDAAERSQAVLFFDEADAIFGRRTDANDAQARWANLETAYLLSRIDTYDGLVLLASNLRVNIDQAFVRRLDVIIEFDEPGPAEREVLWRTHLPDHAPIAADVDLAQLAEIYPMTGGLIRNASLAAAFHVAGRAGTIDQRALVDAVHREYQKAGRSFPGVPRGLSGTAPGGS